jgi:hypothetical protein
LEPNTIFKGGLEILLASNTRFTLVMVQKAVLAKFIVLNGITDKAKV